MVSENNLDPNEELSDELSQDQQELDQFLDNPSEVLPAGPTLEQLAERITAQEQLNNRLMAENRGLQSKVDTGLNAIRRDAQRDAQAWAEYQVGGLRSELETRAYLESLDEDQRPLAEGLIRRFEQNQYVPQQQLPQEQYQEPQHYQSPQEQLQAAWEPYCQFAEQMGIPRGSVNWALVQSNMADANLMPDYSRNQVFQDHIASLRAQSLGISQQTVSQPQQNRQGGTPPVQSGSRNGGGNLRTPDQIRDAYLEDTITHTEYQERMRALGESV